MRGAVGCGCCMATCGLFVGCTGTVSWLPACAGVVLADTLQGIDVEKAVCRLLSTFARLESPFNRRQRITLPACQRAVSVTCVHVGVCNCVAAQRPIMCLAIVWPHLCVCWYDCDCVRIAGMNVQGLCIANLYCLWCCYRQQPGGQRHCRGWRQYVVVHD